MGHLLLPLTLVGAGGGDVPVPGVPGSCPLTRRGTVGQQPRLSFSFLIYFLTAVHIQYYISFRCTA